MLSHWSIHSLCLSVRRTQYFVMDGVYLVGAGPGGLGDGSPPVGSGGKAPVGGLGDCKM